MIRLVVDPDTNELGSPRVFCSHCLDELIEMGVNGWFDAEHSTDPIVDGGPPFSHRFQPVSTTYFVHRCEGRAPEPKPLTR